MPKVFRVTLSEAEREELEALIRSGTASARKLTRARILLKADQADDGRPAWTDREIAAALDVHEDTVANVRRRLVERGLAGALSHKPQDRPSKPRTFDGRAEARLTALACSAPPAGRKCWTLQLLADRLVELRVVPAVSADTIGRALKKMRSSRGGSNSG
jgi:transposase